MKWILVATAIWFNPAENKVETTIIETETSAKHCAAADSSVGDKISLNHLRRLAAADGGDWMPVILQNHCIKRMDA